MAPSYEIDATLRLVRLNYGGIHPTISEWKATMQTIFADPRFGPGCSFLFDKRGCPAATTQYVKDASEFYLAHTDKLEIARWAILVSDPLSFGMSRMTEGYCGSRENVRAFIDLAEAERWLAAGVRA
ncbi:MAG: hypothetical protein ABMA13_11970 [Chthoniobacteraceae bacterium]